MRTLLVPPPLAAGAVEITGPEAHHGRNVLRLAPGDRLRLCDGDGRDAIATVEAVERARILCTCGESLLHPPGAGAELRVAVAPPKAARWDRLVRQLTELGVGTIHPLQTARGERAPAGKRARRVAAEALKQCGRVRMPRLGPMWDISALLARPERCILCAPDGRAAHPSPPSATVLVIGPAGGFDPVEEEMLSGCERVRLSAGILRSETAAVAAVAVWLNAWERA